jgi:lysophospholipase L1-like esterase
MKKKKLLLAGIIILFLFSSIFISKKFSINNLNQIKILCIGDSITESSYGNYPKILQSLFHENGIPIKVVSAGRPGNNSGEYLGFLNHSSILEKTNPSIILIMLGTNDVRIDSDKTSKRKYIENMKNIIRIIKNYEKKRGNKIIIFLLTPPPIFNIDINTFNNKSIYRLKKEIAPAVRKFAKKNRLHLIDIYNYFINKPNLLPGIHPSEKGFYKMSKYIYKKLLPYIIGFPSSKFEKLNRIFKGKIVFQSDRSGNEDIFLIDKNGVKQITKNKNFDGYPILSPNGKKIVFESNRSGKFEIYTYNFKTKSIKKLFTSPSKDRYPFWSYDGKYIYFSRLTNGKEQIYRYDFLSRKIKQLTSFKGRNALPSVSPDNRYLLITSNRFIGWNIYKMDLKTKKIKKLSKGYGGCRGRFSHSGKYIAWVSHKFDHKGDIILTPADKFKPVRLTLDSNKHDYFPSFSPDDKFIVYASGPKLKSGNYDIKIIEISTGKIWQITSSPAKDMMPYWGI